MRCVSCLQGFDWECQEQGNCGEPEKVDPNQLPLTGNGAKNVSESEVGSGIQPSVSGGNHPVPSVSAPDESEDESDSIRTYKDDSSLRDQQSTGRKRAAKLFPLDFEAECEWRMKKNCGGGDFPITGCLAGMQQARHHGPIKNTLNNDKDNVHRICHTCLGGQVRILTADLHWIPAGEVQIGMELIGFSESLNHGKTVFEKSVVESVSRVIEPSYQMFMADGSDMLVSHNHQWVSSSPGRHHVKWRTMDQLNPGYNLRRLVQPWGIDNSRDAGWFAGFLDGEGCLSGTQLSCAQKDNGDGIAEKMWEMFKKYTEYNLHKTVRPANGNNQRVTVARATNLPDILQLVGMVRPNRFISRFPEFLYGKSPLMVKDNRIAIEEMKFIGDQEVMSIQTSSRTFVAEGFLSHNCHNRWHTLNDPGYVWDKPYEAHAPIEANIVEMAESETFWQGRKLVKAKD